MLDAAVQAGCRRKSVTLTDADAETAARQVTELPPGPHQRRRQISCHVCQRELRYQTLPRRFGRRMESCFAQLYQIVAGGAGG